MKNMIGKIPKTDLRSIAKVVAGIAFIANLLTVILFIRDLFFGNVGITFDKALAQVAIIFLVFIFSLLLLMFSREESATPSLDLVASLFSWLYIMFAALIFGIVSLRFIYYANYSLGEFVGYTVLIAFIAGLGYSLATAVRAGQQEREVPTSPVESQAGTYRNWKFDDHYFAVPFMAVALVQIVLWVVIIFTGQPLTFFSLTFIGNLLLFVYAGLFVIFFIGYKKFRDIAISTTKTVVKVLRLRWPRKPTASADSETKET
jgi:hypothetical protein